jgi:tetratricopeptide (TPR) repeat protein
MLNSKVAVFLVILFGAALPMAAQSAGAPPKRMPTPFMQDSSRDPTKNGMANSAATPTVAIPKGAGETVSMTTLTAPPEARAAYEKGVRAYNKQKFPEAQKQLEKAVEIDPKFAVAWYSLGVCLGAQNKAKDAAAAYRRSVAADPKYPDPYARLAAVALDAGKWQEAADDSGRLIHMDPMHFPEAYFYNSVANLRLSQFGAAERSARDTLRMDTAHKYPKAEQVLGLALANEKDYDGARTHLTVYRDREKNPAELALVRRQLAIVEEEALEAGKMAGKKQGNDPPAPASGAAARTEEAEVEESQQQ